jgi:hypothetical protein
MTMNIWSAWLQGRNNAPEHVQKIFSLWEKLNPNYTLNVIEADEADEIINNLGIKQAKISPQVKTNLVRTYLLKVHGGVWVDSTLLPTKPLESWLFPDLFNEGFFAFRSSGAPELVLQNWFLCSEMNNPIIDGWLTTYVDYFQSPRYYPTWKRAIYHRKIIDFIKHKMALIRSDYLYFVEPDRGRKCSFYPYAAHNYNLKYLLNNRSDLAEIWQKVPTRYSTLPSMIGQWSKDTETPTDNFIELALEALPLSPVHKLNHQDKRFNRLIDKATEAKLL